MRLLKFDIMRPIGGGCERFVETLRYSYNPLWKFDIKAFMAFVLNERPRLRGKVFNAYPQKRLMLDEGIQLEMIHFKKESYEQLNRK